MPPSHEILKKLYYFDKRETFFQSTSQQFTSFITSHLRVNHVLMTLYLLLSNITFVQSQGKLAKARNDNKSVNFRRSVVILCILCIGLNDLT